MFKIALILVSVFISSTALAGDRTVLKDKANNKISEHSSHKGCMKARSNKSKAGIKGTYCVSA